MLLRYGNMGSLGRRGKKRTKLEIQGFSWPQTFSLKTKLPAFENTMYLEDFG